MTFDGFISYSHAADGRLAPAVQGGLHRLGRPWHRRRALWIFRDQTGLSVTPGLWSSIQTALDGSQYFVLLASPEAARSPWVNREIEHWVATKSAAQILPVLTDGNWRWDAQRGDFAEDSTAVPEALRGVFAEEPLFLDLRWARDEGQLSLQHSRFRDAVAQLAAPMHGVSKDELESEDVRQHRHARRMRSIASTVLVILTLVASLTGALAVRKTHQATAALVEVQHQEQVASEQRGNAQRSAGESLRQQQNARTQQDRARAATQETQRQQNLTRTQQGLAERAAAEATRQEQKARRQQQLAKRAAALAREQQALAEEQAKLALQSGNESRRQKLIADQQRRLADEAAKETRRQTQIALQQQRFAEEYAEDARRQKQAALEQRRLAEQFAEDARREKGNADQQLRIAISRRLINQAKATMDTDPGTALRLGAAAQRLQPDAESRRELTGMVAATHYAGSLSDVQGVAYSSTGIVATVDSDFTTSMWNVTDRANPVRISRLIHDWALFKPAFSPDGRTLAVIEARTSFTPVLWNVADPANPVVSGVLPGEPFVTSMVFSPDGRTLATADLRDSWSLWDVADPSRPRLLVTQADEGISPDGIAFSPDGRTIVTLANAATIWDVQDRKNPIMVSTLAGSWSKAAINPKDSTLAMRNYDGLISIWSLSNLKKPTQLRSLPGFDGALEFSPDGMMLAAGDGGTATVLLDLWYSKPVQVARMPDPGGVTQSIGFSPDGHTLVTLTSGSTATLWNVAERGATRLLGDVPEHLFYGVEARALDPGARSLTEVAGDGKAAVWDVTDQAKPVKRATFTVPGGRLYAAAISPNGDIIATVKYESRESGAPSGPLTLTDVADPTRPKQLAVLPSVPDLGVLAFSPDGRTLAAGGLADVVLWDLTDRRNPTRLGAGALDVPTPATADLPVSSIAWSPDSHTIAVADADSRMVTMWDVTNRSDPVLRARLKGHGDVVDALAFSPDGRILATGSRDRRAILWNVVERTHPRKLAVLIGHGAAVQSIAFAADGHTLATGTADETALLWDIDDLTKPTRVAIVNDRRIRTKLMMFHPDGHTLVAAGPGSHIEGGRSAYSTAATFWSLADLDDLRANPADQACAIAGRGLTADE